VHIQEREREIRCVKVKEGETKTICVGKRVGGRECVFGRDRKCVPKREDKREREMFILQQEKRAE